LREDAHGWFIEPQNVEQGISNVEVRRSELLAVAEVRRQKVEVRRQKVEVREALLADPNTLQHARGA